jgi:hypothetical protein
MPSTPAPRALNERRSLSSDLVSTRIIGNRFGPSTAESVAPSCRVWVAAAALSK